MNSSIQERALALLGSGIKAENVASALGVTPSYISQLLSDEDFSNQVMQLKFETLSKHTQRDAGYDRIEDSLIEKLEKSLPLMLRPGDILGAIKTINGAKRRGQDSTDGLVDAKNIVQITMPTQIVQQFTTNINNQVIKTGDKDLLTIQSGDLRKLVDEDSLRERVEVTPETEQITNQETEDKINSETNIIEENEILASL